MDRQIRPAVFLTKLGLDAPWLEIGARRMQQADEGAGDIGRRIQDMGKCLRCGRLGLHRPVQNDVGQYAHEALSVMCPSSTIPLSHNSRQIKQQTNSHQMCRASTVLRVVKTGEWMKPCTRSVDDGGEAPYMVVLAAK